MPRLIGGAVTGGASAGLDEPLDSLDLAAEVGRLQFGSPDRLIHEAQVGHGELRRAEAGGERRVLEFGAGTANGVGHDPVVVEGQVAAWAGNGGCGDVGFEIFNGNKPCGSGVGAAVHRFECREDRPEGHGHHPLAGVPIRSGVGPELFEVSGPGIEGGFFEQFPAGGCLGVLVGVQEAAREGQAPEEGGLAAFDQQQLEAAIPNREQGDVGRDGEGGVVGGVVWRA